MAQLQRPRTSGMLLVALAAAAAVAVSCKQTAAPYIDVTVPGETSSIIYKLLSSRLVICT
jgi:hypothetical protein